MNQNHQAQNLPTAAPDPTTQSGTSLNKIIRLLKDAQGTAARSIPPVDQWNPQFCGNMDLTVKANGEWWHEGSRIGRDAMIRLFASVLWREDEQYYLKTPVEKLAITVEDVPLLVTRIEKVEDNGTAYLTCMTQTGDVVVIDAAHPVFLRAYHGEVRPYIRVRWNLEALIHRNAFYHLLDEGEFVEKNGKTIVKLTSGDFECELDEETLSP
ncbi:DUF1285 domain-containing protein [Alkanindiges sp. WGS2144]|uniref:DUF1285 domain-containing protein n=1 Tax=Alkanindiges sp. WGS2144 TaxID=3366808 RepID=UPI003750A923